MSAIPRLDNNTFAVLSQMDWDFAGESASEDGHNLHPYPAKFPAQIPRRLIEHLSKPGDVVLDPFGGSGTTALEAVRSGRSMISIDANPIGFLVSKIKTNPPQHADIEHTRQLLEGLSSYVGCGDVNCGITETAPRIANITKWYSPTVIHELCHIRATVMDWKEESRRVALLALGQSASKLSFQESETRYVSVVHETRPGDAYERFTSDLRRILVEVEKLTAEPVASTCVLGDSREPESYPCSEGTVNLVVTSPPYPNSYDYHLYHRFRLFWTGYDPADLRRIEIGSHLRQQTISDPVADYESDMSRVLAQTERVLASGSHAVFVVGSGLYRGTVYDTASALAQLGEKLGLSYLGRIGRRLPEARRSVTSAGRRLRTEDLVFFRKPIPTEIIPPLWRTFPYEDLLAERERVAIGASGTPEALSRLTFARGVTLEDRTFLTDQYRLEATGDSRRKNSTYATHGIHRYKGKFYPQLGRCLLNLSTEPGQVVLDPFCGSGTILLEASLLGLRSHGIELNPVGAATGAAKIRALTIPMAVLGRATRSFERTPASRPTLDLSLFPTKVHDELQSWFPHPVLARLSGVLRAIESLGVIGEGAEDVQLLARVCLSDLVREVSQQDPADLRIRRRAEPLTDAPLEQLFLKRWTAVVLSVERAKAVVGRLGEAHVQCGDSASAGSWPTEPSGDPIKVDCIVTSPPYASALPYIDTDRLSLAAIFGVDRRGRAGLESSLVGSREVGTQEYRTWSQRIGIADLGEELPSSTLTFLTALREAVDSDLTAGFRRKQTPAVLARYFSKMSKVLRNSVHHLRPGASAWFVLGDSTTTVQGQKWTIPTTEEVTAIAKHHGLELEEQIPITVTRENMKHSKNAITANTLVHFRAQ